MLPRHATPEGATFCRVIVAPELNGLAPNVPAGIRQPCSRICGDDCELLQRGLEVGEQARELPWPDGEPAWEPPPVERQRLHLGLRAAHDPVRLPDTLNNAAPQDLGRNYTSAQLRVEWKGHPPKPSKWRECRERRAKSTGFTKLGEMFHGRRNLLVETLRG